MSLLKSWFNTNWPNHQTSQDMLIEKQQKEINSLQKQINNLQRLVFKGFLKKGLKYEHNTWVEKSI